MDSHLDGLVITIYLEEALEKVMEYIPVIKDEVLKQKERDALGEIDPNLDDAENEEDGEKPKNAISRAEHNETTFEKIKRRVFDSIIFLFIRWSHKSVWVHWRRNSS